MNVFLVTRPIQYINVLNLPFKIRHAILLLQNSFSTFDTIHKIAKEDKECWSDIVVLDTNNSIFKWLFNHRHSIDAFTTYSDLGVRWYVLFNIMRRDIKISVYEEGLATYASHGLTAWKKIMYSVLNRCPMPILYLGAHRKVANIYVYDVPLHNTLIPSALRKVRSFRYPLTDLLNKEDLHSMVYSHQGLYRDKNVCLYLTNWTISEKALDALPKETDWVKLIKPHPKLALDDKNLTNFDGVIGAEFVAEVVISNLLCVVKHLMVIHEGSTSMLHFIPNEKLIEICVPSDTSLAYRKAKETVVQLYNKQL